MASYGQGFSIVTCVAAVIAAFRDADTLVQRLKVRRVASRVPPPPDDLEECVYYAPDEIEREKRRGLDRFGEAFDRGDHIAIIEIQQITIQMQIGLLDQLRRATEDDGFEDYEALIDLADSARDSTKSALIGLRKRLMHPGSAPEAPAQHRPQEQFVRAQQPPPPPPKIAMPPTPPARRAPPPPPPAPPSQSPPQAPSPVNYQQPYSPDMLSPDVFYRSRADSSVSFNDGASDGGGSQHNPGRKSIMGFFRRPSTLASGNEPYMRQDDASQGSRRSSASHNVTRSVGERAWQDPYMPNAAMNPMRNDSTASNVRDTVFSHGSVSSRSGMSSVKSTPGTTASNASRGPRNIPTVPATLTTPTPENDFLGFCKGAWRIQNDDPKAIVERRDFTKSAQSSVTYPSCSKCAFKGHINSKVIWNKTVTDPVRGIKYRWSLLAKSHVHQRNVTDLNYGYQCIFCVFQGYEHCIYTVHTYLDHLSQEHRGQAMDDVILYRTRCVNDRICKDSEKFDINLFPLEDVQEDFEDKKSDDVVVSGHFIHAMDAYELSA